MATFLILLGIACFIIANRRSGPLGRKSKPLVMFGSCCLFFGVVLFVVIFVHQLIDSMLAPRHPKSVNSSLSSYHSKMAPDV